MTASCFLPYLLREALRVAPGERLGAVVLVGRRGRDRWLPAVVEHWHVRWDVFWPAGPEEGRSSEPRWCCCPSRVRFCPLSQCHPSLGCCGTWGCSSCLPVTPTAASPRCWCSGPAAAGPPPSEAGGPQRVARLRGKEGPPAEGGRKNSEPAHMNVPQSSSGRAHHGQTAEKDVDKVRGAGTGQHAVQLSLEAHRRA